MRFFRSAAVAAAIGAAVAWGSFRLPAFAEASAGKKAEATYGSAEGAHERSNALGPAQSLGDGVEHFEPRGVAALGLPTPMAVPMLRIDLSQGEGAEQRWPLPQTGAVQAERAAPPRARVRLEARAASWVNPIAIVSFAQSLVVAGRIQDLKGPLICAAIVGAPVSAGFVLRVGPAHSSASISRSVSSSDWATASATPLRRRRDPNGFRTNAVWSSD